MENFDELYMDLPLRDRCPLNGRRLLPQAMGIARRSNRQSLLSSEKLSLGAEFQEAE